MDLKIIFDGRIYLVKAVTISIYHHHHHRLFLHVVTSLVYQGHSSDANAIFR